MFLPIGDSPNFRATPWVTYGLIALNVAVYLLTLPLALQPADPRDPAARAYLQVVYEETGQRLPQISAYDAVVFTHGFKPGAPQGVDILTSMFMHGGLWHLLGNMLFLWIYGDNVEHRLGRLGYLAAYLATGFAAAFGDALLRPDSLIPAVGASGAISGVLGLYFVWFPKNRVRVFVFLFPLLMDVIEIPARIVLAIYLVVDNLLPAFLGAGGGVAHGAHIGGFVAALALGWGLDRVVLRRGEPEVRRAPRPARDLTLRAALDGDDLPGALSTLMGMPASRSRDVPAADVLDLGSRLETAGHLRAALAVYQRLAVERPHHPAASEAHLGAARALRRLGLNVEAYQQLAQVLEGAASPETRERALQLLAELRREGTVPRRW